MVPTYLPATRYGGPIRSVHGLCKQLAKAGHDVHVYTTNVDGPGDSDVLLNTPVELDGVKIWYFPSTWLRRLYWAPSMAKSLRAQIDTFDLVHLHSVFLWPTWAAARLARKAGVPYLVAPRGMLVNDLIRRKSRLLKSLWINLIERRNLKQASAIHVTAEVEKTELVRLGLSLPDIIQIPNGIDADDMLTDEKPVVDGDYILYLGRLNWKKGLDSLVKAIAQVPGSFLVIAGNDEENYQTELERIAAEYGVEARIMFLGAVQGKTKWRLFKDAQLLVLPSISENFGIVVLEAMAMGCPVIVTEGVGMAQYVDQYECGLVTTPEPMALAANINKMLENESGRLLMGLNGQKASHEQFSWEKIAQQAIQVYEIYGKNIEDYLPESGCPND